MTFRKGKKQYYNSGSGFSHVIPICHSVGTCHYKYMTLKIRHRETRNERRQRRPAQKDDTGDSIDSDKDTTRLDIICTEICTVTHD